MLQVCCFSFALHPVLGCSGDEASFTVDYEGDRVLVDVNDQDFTCAGNMQLLDEQVEALENLWGRGVSSKIRVSWSAGPPEGCPGLGCYAEGIAAGGYASLSHEIVHAYVDQAFPATELPSFLSEGVADALQGKDGGLHRMTFTELLGTGQLVSGSEYGAAGHFTRWLVEEFGVDTVADIFDRIDEPGDASVMAAFEGELGLSAAEIDAAYMNSALIYPGWGPFSCTSLAGPNQWSGESIVIAANLSCETSIGRPDLDGEGGYLWQPFRLDLDEGVYTIDGSNASFSLVQCATDGFPSLPLGSAPGYWSSTSRPWPWLPEVGGSVTDEVHTRSLDAGTYLLWVGLRSERDDVSESVMVEVIREE